MKKFIVWKKRYDVGIEKINRQHQKFVDLINEAYNLSESRKINIKNIFKILNDLTEYGRVHFTTEEDYFKKYNYPDAEAHIIEHEKILKKLLNFYDNFSDGKGNIKKLLLFVRDWFDSHCYKYDQKYARYFKKIGVKS